jgi:hypothetical protein
MSRSESLQTGTAALPRILLPNANAQFVFTIGMATHSSYPGSHPNAIEYMQWDATEKNFRFHEIILDNIPATGSVPARSRGVSIDDSKCSKCHSTQNVYNSSSYNGTTGIPPGNVQFKNKPNWDAMIVGGECCHLTEIVFIKAPWKRRPSAGSLIPGTGGRMIQFERSSSS